jgi:hypothetical protein
VEARGLASRLDCSCRMRAGALLSVEYVIAGATVAAALGAGVLGLLGHLCWLALTDPRELVAVLGMFWRVVTG